MPREHDGTDPEREPEPTYRTRPPTELSPRQIEARAAHGRSQKALRDQIRAQFAPGSRIRFHPPPGRGTIRSGQGTFLRLELYNERKWRVVYRLDDYRPTRDLNCSIHSFLADRPEPLPPEEESP